MDYPYKPPKHLQHLADFGDKEVTKEVAGKCPNCGSTQLRYDTLDNDPLSDIEAKNPHDTVVLCDDCRTWCYEDELDNDDADSDDQEENNDVDYEDSADKDDYKRAAFLALGQSDVDPVAPMEPLGPLENPSQPVEYNQGLVEEPQGDQAADQQQAGNVLPFETPDAARVDLVGGKGANLATLTQAGLPVPPGFSIPADVFMQYVPDPQHLIELTQQKQYDAAQHYVMAMDTPRDEILAAFDALGYERVAVRSSAVAEDSEDASYAGRQATLLQQSRDGGRPVTDKDGKTIDDYGVVEAVKHCWSSFFTEMAVEYREKVGALDDLRMAVVVQAMVDADAAGTAFTEDPTLPEGHMLVRANTINVAAVSGLGEGLVSGEKDPDTYRIDRQSMQVVQMEIMNGGLLRPEHVAQLADLGSQLEQHFNGPQDIEWAIKSGQIHLLQSRPITT